MPTSRARAAFEIALVAAPGVVNVVTFGVPYAKTALVVVTLLVWVAYAALRVRSDRAVLRGWGFGFEGIGNAARVIAGIAAPLVLAIGVYGFAASHFPPPRGFWVIIVLYPLWGVAQQFLLNAILARDLQRFLPAQAALVLAAVGYAVSHAPDWPLVALTIPAGLLWVWVYKRTPNLWVLGIAHGVIGTCVYYGVLGRDPFVKLFL